MAISPTTFVMTPVLEVDYGRLLNEARAAQHSILMGESAKVFVDQNGERIEYNSTNINRLGAYIALLERKLGIGSTLGPMKVFF